MKIKEVYTLAEIKEQEEGVTEEQRIQQVVSHEAGHAIIAMCHGLIPKQLMVSLHGTHGITVLDGACNFQIRDHGLWDVHLGGYWANKVFLDWNDKGFFRQSTSDWETDWDKVGNLSKYKIEQACKKITRKMDELWLPINDLYEQLTMTLYSDGVVYNNTLCELFNDYLQCEDDEGDESTEPSGWGGYDMWWRFGQR